MKSLLPFILIFPAIVFADVPEEQRSEVDHLFAFVKSTQCKIKRNFSYHSGKEAADHMKKKYDYFRDEIKNTEDFIRLSATKSLLTGKSYKVKCADADLLETNRWLTTELKVFRAAKAAKENANKAAPKPSS